MQFIEVNYLKGKHLSFSKRKGTYSTWRGGREFAIIFHHSILFKFFSSPRQFFLFSSVICVSHWAAKSALVPFKPFNSLCIVLWWIYHKRSTHNSPLTDVFFSHPHSLVFGYSNSTQKNSRGRIVYNTGTLYIVVLKWGVKSIVAVKGFFTVERLHGEILLNGNSCVIYNS